MQYEDRSEAGRELAVRLANYVGRDDVLVLGLPRGGVPVAYEVARALRAPWDVFLVRKLGVPGRAELAMGAIASGGVRIRNDEVTRALGITADVFNEITEEEREELLRRELLYRGKRPAPKLKGRIVILIDDGLATGSTMKAAITAVRLLRPKKVVVAVPVAAADTCHEIAQDTDELICPYLPEPFYAVGYWYRDFAQISDAEVRELLTKSLDEPVSPHCA